MSTSVITIQGSTPKQDRLVRIQKPQPPANSEQLRVAGDLLAAVRLLLGVNHSVGTMASGSGE